jgi:hypothetical protein
MCNLKKPDKIRLPSHARLAKDALELGAQGFEREAIGARRRTKGLPS